MNTTGDYRGLHRPLEDTDPIHELGGSSDGTRGASIPPDVYEHPDWYGWGDDLEAHARVIRAVRGRPDATVRLYRAAPPGVATINPGDWCAIVESYARQHAMHNDNPEDDWPVYYADVPASTVRTGSGDIMEWGYWGDPVPAVEMAASA